MTSIKEEIEAKMKKLKKLHPEAHVTYFPVEQRYLVHIWGRQLSGMSDKLSVIDEAIATLQKEETE
jgi:ABC-type sugar transport system ATPase subunit